MTVEEYLESPEAEREVEHLLAKGGSIALSIEPGRDGRCWTAHDLGAWRRVVFRPGWGCSEEVAVLYRAEGGLFIVTDNSTALAALRQRTGAGPLEATRAQDGLLQSMRRRHRGADGRRWPLPPTSVLGGAIEAILGVPAADLPWTICVVMLAAWRVAHLTVPEADRG